MGDIVIRAGAKTGDVLDPPTYWVRADPQPYPFSLLLRSPDGEWQADVRADGCVHIWHAVHPAGPIYDAEGRKLRDADLTQDDYWHICDLPNHIGRLSQLQEIAEGWEPS